MSPYAVWRRRDGRYAVRLFLDSQRSRSRLLSDNLIKIAHGATIAALTLRMAVIASVRAVAKLGAPSNGIDDKFR